MINACVEPYRSVVQQSIEFLEQTDEFQSLLRRIPDVISVHIVQCGRALAFTGRIELDPSLFQCGSSENSTVIQAIYLETNNIDQRKQFRALTMQKAVLPPDEWVQRYELLEYRSCWNTRQFIRKYLQENKWKHARLAFLPQKFLLHYTLQQIEGHSHQIAQRHGVEGYRGTLGLIDGDIRSSLIDFTSLLIYTPST
jgi:hypothetical protein